jgi:hypothetical protein
MNMQTTHAHGIPFGNQSAAATPERYCTRCPGRPQPLNLPAEFLMTSRKRAVSRDYEPVPGQWYENLEEEESFRVLSVDEDSELVEIEYLDGDIEEIDIEAWHEMDLERTDEPEGWSEPDEDEDEDEDDDDFDDEDEDDDEDDDDFDDDEDEEDDER